MLRVMRAALFVMMAGLLMAALNAPLRSASDLAGPHHRATAPIAMSHDSQVPCGDHDAPRGKAGCCVGTHCAAGHAMAAPLDQGPIALEPQLMDFPRAQAAHVTIGVGPALEPPRQFI